MARVKRDLVRTNINIPAETMDQIEFYLMDPVRGRMRYGALSAITNVLWLQLIRKLQEPGVRPAEVLQHYGVDFGANDTPDDTEDEGECEDA